MLLGLHQKGLEFHYPAPQHLVLLDRVGQGLPHLIGLAVFPLAGLGLGGKGPGLGQVVELGQVLEVVDGLFPSPPEYRHDYHLEIIASYNPTAI